jgi:hypothetical protein
LGDWLVTVTSFVRECTDFCADRIDSNSTSKKSAVLQDFDGIAATAMLRVSPASEESIDQWPNYI